MACAQDIINIKNKLIQSALDLAAQKSWGDVAMDDIIDHAGVDGNNARALLGGKDDIITSYARHVDLQMAENLDGAFGDDDTTLDKIFDYVMERFDILNDNRNGVISILNAITLNPSQSIHNLPIISRTVETILNGVNDDSSGWRRAVMITALSGIYIKTLRTWAMDDSADMAATMADLDKSLGYLDKIVTKS